MTEAQEKRRERNRRYYESQKAKKEAARSLRIGEVALARSRAKPRAVIPNIFAPAVPPKSVASGMALDSAYNETLGWALGGLTQETGVTGFLGYPVLAELAQRPEYRRISEIIAMEMTRKWVRLKADGDDDKADRIKAIEEAMARLRVRDVFREAVEQDGFFGRGHIYLDFGVTDDRGELRQSIGDGWGDISKVKVGRGSLRRLRSVEAVWCYPADYNASDPLKPDWFKPNAWFVQGKEVHSTRLLTVIGREVPDLLKPAYSFGGLSLSQMAKPYVDNWLRTRESVADLISSFSNFVLKTNLADKLGIDGEDLFKRADFFNNVRDNRGLMVVDKELEDFANVSASLATLDALQAQTQEHMASVSGIPLVKLLGIQPAGLNASSEGELECFYTWINALQESMLSEPLRAVLGFIQLSLFGDVDPAITFSWEPLKQVTEKDAAEIRRINADTGQVLIAGKVISPEEERQRIASDDDSIYDSIDVSAAPAEKLTPIEKATIAAGITGAIVQAEGSGLVDTPIAMEELRKLSLATGVWTSITEADVVEAKLAPEPPEPEMPAPASGHGPDAPPFGQDADFKESDHPRNKSGQFSEGKEEEPRPPEWDIDWDRRNEEFPIEFTPEEIAEMERAEQHVKAAFKATLRDLADMKRLDREAGGVKGGGGEDADHLFEGGQDADFKEDEHPRDDGGRFKSGGGGKPAPKPAAWMSRLSAEHQNARTSSSLFSPGGEPAKANAGDLVEFGRELARNLLKESGYDFNRAISEAKSAHNPDYRFSDEMKAEYDEARRVLEKMKAEDQPQKARRKKKEQDGGEVQSSGPKTSSRSAETSTEVHRGAQSEAGGAPEARASVEPDAGPLGGQILRAAVDIAGGKGRRVLLSDLRDRFPNVSKGDLDASMLRLQREGKAFLYKKDGSRTESDEHAALHIAGEPRHILWVPFSTEIPSHPQTQGGEHTRPKVAHLNKDLADNVIREALDLGGGKAQQRVLLRDLRKRFPGVSKEDFDETVKGLQRDGKAILYRLDNTVELTPEDHSAALHIAGEPRHILWVRRGSEGRDSSPFDGATDAGWKKDDHPRDEDGKFTSGAGGVSGGGNAKTQSEASTANPRTDGVPRSAGEVVSSFTSDAEMKAHPAYAAAKAGDPDAALDVVADLVKPQMFDQARERFIRAGGGEVAGVVTLVNAGRSGKMAAEPHRIREIERRFGDVVRQELHIDPRAVTADEAQFLLNFRDADALRNRIASARDERGRRLSSKEGGGQKGGAGEGRQGGLIGKGE